MIDPLTFVYWLMIAIWMAGLGFFVLGILLGEPIDGFAIAVAVWALFAIPVTLIWMILWVVVEALR